MNEKEARRMIGEIQEGNLVRVWLHQPEMDSFTGTVVVTGDGFVIVRPEWNGPERFMVSWLQVHRGRRSIMRLQAS